MKAEKVHWDEGSESGDRQKKIKIKKGGNLQNAKK
jgi:hypothetical protein